MLNEIRKGLLAGLGAVLLTKDKVEETVRKFVDDAKLSREDARKLTKELYSTGERQWQEMEKSLSEAMRKGLKNLDIGKKSEFRNLEMRMEEVEKRLGVLEETVSRYAPKPPAED